MSNSTNTARIGHITSSGISALMSNGKEKGTPGKPYYTYIEECIMEARFGLQLESECSARPLSWGNACEKYVLETLLGTEYRPQSQGTIGHPEIEEWVGTPDAMKFAEANAVAEIKCPYTRKSFAIFSACKTIEDVRNNHPDGEKYYWQIVSNACITGVDKAELIVFMPTFEELDAIRSIAENWQDVEAAHFFKWIAFAHYNELPYINSGGYFNHLHIIPFDVPQADKDALTGRVKMAVAAINSSLTNT